MVLFVAPLRQRSHHRAHQQARECRCDRHKLYSLCHGRSPGLKNQLATTNPRIGPQRPELHELRVPSITGRKSPKSLDAAGNNQFVT
jgi:hypothetical protein